LLQFISCSIRCQGSLNQHSMSCSIHPEWRALRTGYLFFQRFEAVGFLCFRSRATMKSCRIFFWHPDNNYSLTMIGNMHKCMLHKFFCSFRRTPTKNEKVKGHALQVLNSIMERSIKR
jgi:hypothetical protein